MGQPSHPLSRQATAMGLGQRPQFSAAAKPTSWKCRAKTPEKCHSSWLSAVFRESSVGMAIVMDYTELYPSKW